MDSLINHGEYWVVHNILFYTLSRNYVLSIGENWNVLVMFSYFPDEIGTITDKSIPYKLDGGAHYKPNELQIDRLLSKAQFV